MSNDVPAPPGPESKPVASGGQASDPTSAAAGESPAQRAIRLGGAWFLNNQDDSFLHYSYDRASNRWSEAHHSARELGALWSITKLATFLGDARYQILAQRGLDHFLSHLHIHKTERYLFLGITPHKVKLSYNAFLVLALLALDHPQKTKILAGLVQGILAHQQASGAFDTFFFSDRATGLDYYPGQALLALGHYYEATGDERCLHVASRALPHYRQYWRDSRSGAFVPWQSQAFSKLHGFTGDAEMADFVFEINDGLLVEMAGRTRGQGVREGLGIVAAVFAEGLIPAYALADQAGDQGRKARYAEAIGTCLRVAISLQAPLEGERLEDLPTAAVGGFISRPETTAMRVDNNQHAVMALMGAYERGLIS